MFIFLYRLLKRGQWVATLKPWTHLPTISEYTQRTPDGYQIVLLAGEIRLEGESEDGCDHNHATACI